MSNYLAFFEKTFYFAKLNEMVNLFIPSVMNKIFIYLIVILSFLSISLSINAFPVNTDCRFGGEVLDVDTVDQTEQVKMICTTTITEPIKHPLWVVDGKIYGNIELDTVMLSSQNAKELIPMVLNSIGISISAEEIKDYTILPPEYGLTIFSERGSAGAIAIFPPKDGSAIFGVRGSAGAIVITTKKKIKGNNK